VEASSSTALAISAYPRGHLVAPMSGVSNEDGGLVGKVDVLQRQSKSYSVDQIEAVVCDGNYAFPCDWAISTILCESSGDAEAEGQEIYNGEVVTFEGWWQIVNGPTDPVQNTIEANIQYVQWQNGERSRPWPNCPKN